MEIETHRLVVAMFPWLVPALLVGFLGIKFLNQVKFDETNLPALLLWDLMALLHGLLPALL